MAFARANLDEETEKEIVESLASQDHSSTIIIVSHRPGILKKASRLLTLEASTETKPAQKASLAIGK